MTFCDYHKLFFFAFWKMSSLLSDLWSYWTLRNIFKHQKFFERNFKNGYHNKLSLSPKYFFYFRNLLGILIADRECLDWWGTFLIKKKHFFFLCFCALLFICTWVKFPSDICTSTIILSWHSFKLVQFNKIESKIWNSYK